MARKPAAETSQDVQQQASQAGLPPVEVRRSKKRTRTVSARVDGERTIVSIPARMTRIQEQQWVSIMLERLAKRERRRRPSDAQLEQRAADLSQRYLGGQAQARSIRWVTNQQRRWGSCSVDDASIRLSHRLQGMPQWVQDYVIVHELAHLLHAGHGPEFQELVNQYPHTARAQAFLEGAQFAWDSPITARP